jgi:hypothetical protein
VKTILGEEIVSSIQWGGSPHRKEHMPKWLKCRIDKGMFSDEFTVTVQTRSGEAVAVFVPKAAADDQRCLVKVRAIENQGKMLAVLPDEHQSVVDVREADLQPA